jgi:HK97 family phage major capsid protein
MPIDTREMREQRHKLIVDARAILDKADEEKRALSAEDRQEYDRLTAEAEKLREQIEDAERRNSQERAEAEEELSQRDEEARRNRDNQDGDQPPQAPRTFDEERRALLASDEYHRMFVRAMTVPGYRPVTEEELRVHTSGTGTSGGYLYASEQFVNEMIAAVTDATIVRQLARVLPPITTADSAGLPVLKTRMSDSTWSSEIGTPTEREITVGRRNLTPHPLSVRTLVSKDLLARAAGVEMLVRDELARASAEAQENAFMTGTGDQKPLGMFVASADGISTGRDVSSGNDATLIKFDGLKNAKVELKAQYWGGAAWVFHRTPYGQLAKEKDNEGRYLMQDSVTAGEPDRLLGFPVRLSEFAPSTMTASQYVGILGNFQRGYWIVDGINTSIKRAEELYIETHQDLFLMRQQVDGAPVLEEAFVRVKLAAS